jgi:hypothetical protein
MKGLLGVLAVLGAAVGTIAVAGAVAPGCGGGACTGAGCGQTVDTFVHWTLIAQQFPGFNETPLGVGAKFVRLDLSGASELSVTGNAQDSQAKLSNLPEGHYLVVGTLLDGQMNPLTKGMAHVEFDTTGALQHVTIDFPFEDFIQSYTGTYYFSATWAGATTCTAAKIMKQRLTLTRNGVVVAGMTTPGEPLDGTKFNCQDTAPDQGASNLPWGPAKLTISGEDGSGGVFYWGTFDTFVGADISNPSFAFTVPSSDAGMD